MLLRVIFSFAVATVVYLLVQDVIEDVGSSVAAPLSQGGTTADADPATIQPGADFPPIDLSNLAALRENADRISAILGDEERLNNASVPTVGSPPYQGIITLNTGDGAAGTVMGRFQLRFFFGNDGVALGGANALVLIVEDDQRAEDEKLPTVGGSLRFNGRLAGGGAPSAPAIYQMQVTGRIGLPGRMTGADRGSSYEVIGDLIGHFTPSGALGQIKLTATSSTGGTVEFTGGYASVVE